MRILQVHNRHRVRGGEDEVVEREYALLTAQGQEVSRHIVDNPASPLASASAIALSPWNILSARSVVNEARRARAEVVHVHNTWFALSPAIVTALARAGFVVVVTLHNFRTACINGLLLREGNDCRLCVGTSPGPGVRHRCYRGSAVLSAFAAAAVVTPRLRKTWQRDVAAFIVLDESVIPDLAASGIPVAKMSVRRNSAPDPGARLHAPSEGTEILYAGRLSEEKGTRVLVDAWEAAAPSGWSLVLCGDGPLVSSLRERGVPGVDLPGRIDPAALRQRMLAARALVFPSICHEAGPLAPVEAAAAGLPIIVSASVGIARGLRESGAGWTVPPGDVDALAGALGRLSNGPALDAAGRAARGVYERSHSPGVAYESLMEVYDAALRAGRTR